MTNYTYCLVSQKKLARLCSEKDEQIESLRAQLEQAREALRSAQDLIFRHHNCSVRVELGQLCPHCTRDGRQPEIDLIAKALKQQEVG